MLRRALVLSGFLAACTAAQQSNVESAAATTPVDTITALDRVPVPAPLGGDVVDHAAAIRLGKALFWDVQAGSDGKQACASCHFSAGVDTRVTSSINPGPDGVFGSGDDRVGSQGVSAATFVSVNADGSETCTPVQDPIFGTARQVTPRNAPTVVGAVFYRELFWDGRANEVFDGIGQSALASQAVGPILSSVEMSCAGRTFGALATKLLDRKPLARQTVAADDSVLANLDGTYRDLVGGAFGPSFDADGQFARVWGEAIQAYESTLIPDQTPMDEFLGGETTALTDSQRRGFGVFAGVRGNCINCHAGPELSDASWSFSNKHGLVNIDGGDQGFHATGVRPTAFTNPEDIGRGAHSVSKANADRGAFKTPALRNVKLTAPYFHNGGAATLKDVVDFYARGGDFRGSASQLEAIVFQPGEEDELLDFLTNALTDCRTEKQRAPFDHPSLDVPNGPSVPAVGAAGTGTCP